jgi:UDP-glucose 4-epimerase
MGNVVVTGGAGFIGSLVVDLIAARGDTPVVVDNLSKGRREDMPVDTDLRIVDITDSSAMQALCAELPDAAAIIHCATQASVVRSTSDPIFDLTTNVAGTINILEIARAKACPLVFTSTGGAIYGEDAPRPTTEASPVDAGESHDRNVPPQ